jgi:pantothenate kinase type III
LNAPLGRGWVLTADLGNGTTKLVGWRAPCEARAEPFLRLAWANERAPDARELAARLAQHDLGVPESCGFSSVAGPDHERAFRELLAAAGCERIHGDLDAGLELDCRNVHTIGADRLFAARGAAEWLGRSCVVLDAGTALTVDALEVGEGARPRFLGGAIAPGPTLLARALALGGARLFDVEPAPGVPALGKETSEALRAGCAVGFRGAAFELARRVGLEAGLAGAPRVLCGGAAAYLMEPEPFWPGELLCEPDLVTRGVAAALCAREAQPR